MKVGNVLFVYRSEGWEMTRFISAIGERREVEHLDGTRQTYHEKRVARVSEKSVPSVAALEAYRDQVDELISSLPLDSLWGHALDSGGTEQIFSPEDLAALVLPNAQSASDDAAAQAEEQNSGEAEGEAADQEEGEAAEGDEAADENNASEEAEENEGAEGGEGGDIPFPTQKLLLGGPQPPFGVQVRAARCSRSHSRWTLEMQKIKSKA